MKDEALTQLSDKLEEIMEEENNHLRYLRSRATFLREIPYRNLSAIERLDSTGDYLYLCRLLT
jgi:hypothetical protein